MDNLKELQKEKCFIKGCKDKVKGIFETKHYCQDHYNEVNSRVKRFRYANGPVYYGKK